MDEAHHSGKEHPFFRIAKSPYVVPNDEAAAVMAARSRKETEKGAGSRSRNANNRLGGEGGTLGYKRGYTHRRGYTGHNQQAQAVAAASRAVSTPRTAADFPKVRGPPTYNAVVGDWCRDLLLSIPVFYGAPCPRRHDVKGTTAVEPVNTSIYILTWHASEEGRETSPPRPPSPLCTRRHPPRGGEHSSPCLPSCLSVYPSVCLSVCRLSVCLPVWSLLLSKVLALVSARAGEATVRKTASRLKELMGRFAADLAAPALAVKEVYAVCNECVDYSQVVYSSKTFSNQ